MRIDVSKAYWEWVDGVRFDDPLSISFTCKQVVDGQSLDEISLVQNIRHFKNILNQKVFGNAYARYGKEVKTLFVMEESVNDRLHVHGIIDVPSRLDHLSFYRLIIEAWSKTRFGYRQMKIERSDNIEGWSHYIMKNRTKKDYSLFIDVTNSSCFNLC